MRVAVFDGRTGRPVSFNREICRIVGMLQTPGRTYEQLLEVITFRPAEGRETPLPWRGSARGRPRRHRSSATPGGPLRRREGAIPTARVATAAAAPHHYRGELPEPPRISRSNSGPGIAAYARTRPK